MMKKIIGLKFEALLNSFGPIGFSQIQLFAPLLITASFGDIQGI